MANSPQDEKLMKPILDLAEKTRKEGPQPHARFLTIGEHGEVENGPEALADLIDVERELFNLEFQLKQERAEASKRIAKIEAELDAIVHDCLEQEKSMATALQRIAELQHAVIGAALLLERIVSDADKANCLTPNNRQEWQQFRKWATRLSQKSE